MLTVPEAARRTKRDPETVRRWIRSGRLRATKVGTQHMIDEADLAEVAEAKSVLVGYDYEAGASVPLSEDLKRRLTG